ncbi:MAG: hypothetical protein RJAPGHWK_003008 [Candidatus Fervidibacter sp.]
MKVKGVGLTHVSDSHFPAFPQEEPKGGEVEDEEGLHPSPKPSGNHFHACHLPSATELPLVWTAKGLGERPLVSGKELLQSALGREKAGAL